MDLDLDMDVTTNKLIQETINNMIAATHNSCSLAQDTNIGIGVASMQEKQNQRLTASLPNKVKTPDWVDVEEGYDIETFKMSWICPSAIVATYRPRQNSLLGGFARVYFVEGGDVDECHASCKPFPQMRGVWKEFKDKNPTFASCFVEDDGKITGPFGIPNMDSISPLVRSMQSIYRVWRHFPNETDFKVVNSLIVEVDCVVKMQQEEAHKEFAQEIATKRKQIQELQEEISKMEQTVNGIYEAAADAMNTLEEHGVDLKSIGEIHDDIRAFDMADSMRSWANHIIQGNTSSLGDASNWVTDSYSLAEKGDSSLHHVLSGI